MNNKKPFWWGLAFGTGLSVQAGLAQAPVERIEVTGSHIRKLESESGLPVTRISREGIERSGATTVAEVLERLPFIGPGGYTVAMGLGDDDRPGLAAISLRGLGSQNTLVLLNGRRLAPYAFNSMVGSGMVNLNQIPLAAVERVEVLRDGASAIYGTDAIGGVVNVILRKDYRGLDASAYASRTEGGGGDSRRYTASAGFGDLVRDRFNVMLVADRQTEAALRASDRPFASTGIRPDLAFTRTSGQTYPANFIGAGTLGGVNVTAAQGCLPSAGSYQVDSTGKPAPLQTYCVHDFTSGLEIYPPSDRKAAFLRGIVQVTPNHQAFAEYHRGSNDIRFAASESPVAGFGTAAPYLYPAGGRHYPSTVTLPGGRVIHPSGDLQLYWRLKEAGLRRNRIETDESRRLAGLKGAIAGWEYETAATFSDSKARNYLEDGWVSDSRLRAAIATGIVDPFSGRPQSPEAQALIDAAKIRGKVRESDAQVWSVDGRASGEIMETMNGPVAVAAGFDHRREEIEERPEPVLYSGDILGGGILPPTTRAERRVTSFFVEANVPLAKTVEAQLALRHDHFSDFGGTTNPKLALRWNASPAWLLRTSYGTGFRAPTLSDLYRPVQRDGFTILEKPDPARCPGGVPVGAHVNEFVECGSRIAAWFGGNPALRPEKSRQWTLGILFEPTPGNTVGIDYWTIRRRSSIQWVTEATVYDSFGIRDPVTALGHFVRTERLDDGSCAGDGAVATPSGLPCPLDHVFAVLENLGRYNVTGLDLSMAWRSRASPAGTVSVRVDGTYFVRYRYQLENDGPYADNVGKDGDNGVVSRWKHVASIEWRRGVWAASLAQNFILGYRDFADGGFPPRRVGSYETFDLRATWGGWKHVSVAAGVRNLFDRAPPAARTAGYFQVGYDPSLVDPRGRTWYLSLKASLP